MKFPTAPRQPFLGLVLAAAAGIILADFFPVPIPGLIPGAFFLAVCGVVLLRWPTLVLTYLLVGLAFALVHTLQTTETAGRWLESRLGDRARAVTVTGCVVTEPKITPGGSCNFLLQLSGVELEGMRELTKATIFVRWRGQAEFGDELRLFGIASPTSAPRNPGEYDMRSYLARRDVYREMFVRYAEDGTLIRHGGGNPVLRAAHRSRNWMQATLCRGLSDSPEVEMFISGLALGLRRQTPEDIEEPFQQTGTLHLFAVAGLHVGIVAQLLRMTAGVSRIPGRLAALIIIPLLLFYAAITGLHISSVRAALMASILLGGIFFEREFLSLNSLAAAAFLLFCWNTNEIFSAGFQLSFAVVGTIILLADPVTRLLHRWSAPDPFLPKSLLGTSRRLADKGLKWAGQASAVSLAAWVGSLVLILAYFYLVTPISLFANLVVVPIAFGVLAIALLSLIAAPLLPWFSVVFNNANWFLAKTVLLVVHLFAQIPAGHWYLEHPHWPDGTQVRLDVLDLGAGGAAHFHTRSSDWLFDCGSTRDYERILRPYLHATGVNRIHGLLLTHGDASHIGGTAGLLEDSEPAVVLDNRAPDRSIVHRRLRSLFKQRGLQTREMAAGDKFEPDSGVAATILFPSRVPLPAATDDLALVIQMRLASVSLLLTSDSGAQTEKALLQSGMDLRSDILIKGQNHSSASGSDAFLDAVQPRLIIATSSDFPESERIRDDWAEKVRARGIKLFRQDETGAVELRFRRDDWQARAYVTREIFRSANR